MPPAPAAVASPSASEPRGASADRSGWLVSDDPGWRVLAVTGEDAAPFLHALLTGDVRSLAPGSGRLAGLLDRKGHLQAALLVHRAGEDLLLVVPQPAAGSVAETLMSHRIMDRVEVEERTDLAVASLSGSGVPLLLSGWGVATDGEGWRPGDGATIDGVRLVRTRLTGEIDLFAIGEPGAVRRLFARLAGSVRRISQDEIERLRIEAGLAGQGHEIDGRRLPQEIDLHDLVSLDKGCYLGQETMARLTHRGQARKGLAGWILGEGEPPRPPCPVYLAGEEVGDLTSVSPGSPATGLPALGILKTEAFDPRGDYRFGSPGGATGRLAALPFVKGSGYDVDPRRRPAPATEGPRS